MYFGHAVSSLILLLQCNEQTVLTTLLTIILSFDNRMHLATNELSGSATIKKYNNYCFRLLIIQLKNTEQQTKRFRDIG